MIGGYFSCILARSLLSSDRKEYFKFACGRSFTDSHISSAKGNNSSVLAVYLVYFLSVFFFKCLIYAVKISRILSRFGTLRFLIMNGYVSSINETILCMVILFVRTL